MQFRSSFFSGSYAEAREKFLASAGALGGIIETHTNVVAGDVKAYPLATDICYCGPKKPRCLILISSGSHGVEGFCGSGIQVGLLENNVVDLFPDGMGVFLIHALNPYGFAYCRRVNEDNVDLNRNFLDFSTATAPDDERSITRDDIYPFGWTGASKLEVERQIHRFIDTHGLLALQKAVSSGQRCYPQDPFFAGTKPIWSRCLWENFIDRILKLTKQVVHLDVHSGLGACGALERILPVHEKGVAYYRAVDWYGEQALSCPAFANSSSPHIAGDLPSALRNRCPEAVTVGLEFGTVKLEEMLLAVIVDNWLAFNRESATSEQKKNVKKRIKSAFYVDTDEWKKAVWQQSVDMIQKTVHGLGAL